MAVLPNVTEVSLDPLGSNAEEVPAGSEETDAVLSELVLPNGLKVVVREDHRLPLAYACLVFKAGCPAENERNAGVTDLMSECLLKGIPPAPRRTLPGFWKTSAARSTPLRATIP